MSVQHHATILYSCPCGRNHLLHLDSDQMAGLRVHANAVAASLARQGQMVRLTTWWEPGPTSPGRRRYDVHRVAVGKDGEHVSLTERGE